MHFTSVFNYYMSFLFRKVQEQVNSMVAGLTVNSALVAQPHIYNDLNWWPSWPFIHISEQGVKDTQRQV